MIYINKYHILPTSTFKEEFEEIIYYIKRKLKEPIIAKKFYKNIMKEINSLNFMPERYEKIDEEIDKSRIIRKISVNNYIILYEVKNDTRASFYFTYFSYYSKLSKKIVIL